MKRLYIFLLLTAGFSDRIHGHATSPGDTLKTVKLPKHYFNTTIYGDFYGTGQRTIDPSTSVGKKLQAYQLRQLTLGFMVPVLTKNYYNKDSTRISNLHLLVTGSFARLNPNFDGISDHRLAKSSIGLRGFYNNGKRSIFYVEAAPFGTKDVGYAADTRTYRIASTLLYNCAVTPYFSFRLGYTRTFLWGNRYHLPYIGFRVGRLDKVNFSLQFPRSITFNVPINRYVRTSLFTRPQGGVYSMANVDSLYTKNADKKIFFGRYEFLTGLRVDAFPSRLFNFYLSSGLTTQNYIGLFASTENKHKDRYASFYKEKLKGSLFLNFGLVLRFGKTRSIYNNDQMYNAFDINNNPENGVRPGNGNIPLPQKKIKNISPDDVKDLVDTEDL